MSCTVLMVSTACTEHVVSAELRCTVVVCRAQCLWSLQKQDAQWMCVLHSGCVSCTIKVQSVCEPCTIELHT